MPKGKLNFFMIHKLPVVRIILCGAILLFLFPHPTLAYIDPGTGSYIFQVTGAVMLGSLFFVKSAIRNLKVFLNKHFAGKGAIEIDKKDGK